MAREKGKKGSRVMNWREGGRKNRAKAIAIERSPYTLSKFHKPATKKS